MSFLSGKSQVTVDHGFQLWDLGSRSPSCDVVSVAYPLDFGTEISKELSFMYAVISSR